MDTGSARGLYGALRERIGLSDGEVQVNNAQAIQEAGTEASITGEKNVATAKCHTRNVATAFGPTTRNGAKAFDQLLTLSPALPTWP